MMNSAKASKLACITVVALSLVLFGWVAGYGQVEKAFKGRVLEFWCPYNVGGGFDTYSRAVAKHIPKYLPVRAAIVKNVIGGGGLTGTNKLYAARADGLTIGIVNGAGMIFNQVMETPAAKFDLAKMMWLGRISYEPHLIVVGGKSPFKTIEDLRNANRSIVFSATGLGSDDFLGAAVIAEALGFQLRQVVGFETSTECNLAVIKGDVDGTEAGFDTLMPLIKAKDLRPVLQVALERDPALPEVPTALEVVPADKKAMVVAISNTFVFDRAVGGPPGIPEDRVKALRAAMNKVLHDEKFIQELQKRGRRLAPLEGEKMEVLIKECMAAAGTIKPVLKKAVETAQK